MKASDFILTETFDTDVKGKIVKQTNKIFVTQATIGNRSIRFSAASPNEGDWEIVFMEKSDKKGDTFGKSGSGNELQVFSFVIDSIKLFISTYSPDRTTFTSEKSDVNRTSLYSRIANRIKIPGYHIEYDSDHGQDLFTIIRDK